MDKKDSPRYRNSMSCGHYVISDEHLAMALCNACQVVRPVVEVHIWLSSSEKIGTRIDA